MKKNISINISGIIFHIEEDGYDKLKAYLDTIHRYFATYDDSSEIIADIENRIAEIFLGKLKDGKQVITIEDVEALMATMGGIKDFKEVEVEEEPEEEYEEKSSGDTASSAYAGQRRLFRDENRKILGGVLSGIAHYFSVDPLWIRLIFIILFFGVWFLPSIAAFLTIAYVILWIILPGSYELEEQKKVKKMFRNPDDKVLGGVASGIGAYFGTDVVIIRLLFIILIFFGGTGLILYIILWIMLPEARTITDKMEMQGEPVTLRNIETNIRNSLKMNSGEEESVLAKILLFPFRLIAIIINFLSKILGPVALFLVEAIRVLFGLILVLAAMGLAVGLLITLGVGLGFLSGSYFIHGTDFPLELIRQDISVVPLISGFIVGLIPLIFLVVLGISIITKNLILNARLGWSLFSIWIIGVIVLLVSIPPLIGRYSREGVHTEVENFTLPGDTVYLKIKETGLEDYTATTLRLRGSEDSLFRLEKKFESRGKNREDAIENAKMVKYNVSIEGSTITFDSNIQFMDEARFRGQTLDMILYMPYGKPFRMDADLDQIIRRTIYYYGYREDEMTGNTWEFTPDGLTCLTCPSGEGYSRENKEDDTSSGGYNTEYDFTDFNSIEIGSVFNIEVVQGDDWEVSLSGRDEDVKDVVIRKMDKTLNVNFSRDISRWDHDREEIRVYIRMPELDAINLSGAAKGYVNGFDHYRMDINLSGAASAEMDLKLKDVKINLAGTSRLNLYGSGENMDITLTGASSLDSYDFDSRYAKIDASGISHAKVNVARELQADVSGGSEVRYKGDPQIKSQVTTGSRIIKE